jgi:SAM-dependent methyltransferase
MMQTTTEHALRRCPKRAYARCFPNIFDPSYTVLKPLTAGIRELIAIMKLPSSSTVVDLGCGDCPYEVLFRGRNVRYIGADLPSTDAEVTLEPGKPLALPSGSADAVLSFQVLEHVWDIDWYLGEARRLLHPDGYLLISTHGMWPYHPYPGDFRRWTKPGLILELESRGFKVLETRAILGPLAYTTVMRLTGWLFVLRKLGAPGRVLLALLSVLFNVQALFEDLLTPAKIREDGACVYLMLCQPDSRFSLRPS